MERKQKVISSILSLGLIVSFVVIYYLARGYRIDLKNRQVKGTGMLVANSIPEGAMVYLNEKPYTATNTSISSLKPGKYQAKIQKQGYHTWEKEITIEKELITEVNALLTPLFPELKPLTFTGAKNPLLSPDGQKILFSAPINGETSLWLLEIVERPFNLSSRPRQLATDTETQPYSKAKMQWAPDSQSVLMELGEETLLLDINNKTVKPVENVHQLKIDWEKEIQIEQQKRLQNLPQELVEKLPGFSNIRWAPDNNSLLHQTSEGDQFVFKTITLKPKIATAPPVTITSTPKPFIEKIVYTAPKDQFTKLTWYPDSRHLIVLEKDSLASDDGRLSLIEIDGENKNEFFSGIVKSDHIYPFSNGSKIAILTSFNPGTEGYNLYSVGLR